MNKLTDIIKEYIDHGENDLSEKCRFKSNFTMHGRWKWQYKPKQYDSHVKAQIKQPFYIF